MKTIVLRSTNNQYRVEMKVDLFSTPDVGGHTSSEAFTIMEFVGKNDAEVVAGLNLRELPSSITTMKAFAEANNLLMDIMDINLGETVNTVASVTALAMTSTGALAGGNDTVAYNQPIVVEGGNGPFTFEVTTGALPSGLFLDPINGTITGVPDTVENPTFEVTASDAFGQSVIDATLSIDIAA